MSTSPDTTDTTAARTTLGFWLYIMTDLVLFATLFATFAVLRNNTAGGEPGGALFNRPYILAETLVLLTSSFTCGMALIALRAQQLRAVMGWLAATLVLGSTFLAMELLEFGALVADGDSWQRSGFLSSYFTLVGTHGLHIAIGLAWTGIMLVSLARKGITVHTARRLSLLGIFWHFLDIVWIFIFTFVYMMGAL